MRQYAGFATAAESNRRYRYLLEQGTTGLSVAFDLPTQIGYDSDDPHSPGEVGRVGVAIDSLEDMETLLDGIPLERVSTSMTINATAAILLALYIAVARRRGDPRGVAVGHRAERHPQGVRGARDLHLPARLPLSGWSTDVFAYCAEHVPKWNPISISGYHIREAGATAVQELGLHVRPRPRVRPRRRRRRDSIPSASASGSRSSSPATPTSSRRSRSSARRGVSGRAS